LKEQVHYTRLPQKFIAGTVVYGNQNEVAVGLKVMLEGNGSKRETITNGFGDFEFEDLGENTEYQVTIEADGYEIYKTKVKTSRDLNLEITLASSIERIGYVLTGDMPINAPRT
jgi:hypothetical protein